MSTASASPLSNFTVLAFEPDSGRAKAIQRILSERTRAGLTLVDSKDRLLEALRNGLPDLLLLPALLPPSDESQLFDFLRDANDGKRLEVLVTPYSLKADAGADGEAEAPRGWRRLLSRKKPAQPAHDADERRSFGERIVWALRCVGQARRERAEQFSDNGTTAAIGPWLDRRVHRRYSPGELPWLERVSIVNGPNATLLDLSAGGVLLESDGAMQRDSEWTLRLIGRQGEWSMSFRVVRWQPYAHDGSLYFGACEFTSHFEFDKDRGPNQSEAASVSSDDAVRESVLAEFIRSDEHQGRDRRLGPEEVPWIADVKTPWGAQVDLLNISKTGMLVETSTKIPTGTATEFQLTGPETSLAVPARIVRSEVADVSPLGVKYHAAAAFTKEVKFPRPFGDEEPPASKALAELMADVLSDVDRGGHNPELRRKFVKGLQKLVPAGEIDLKNEPARPEAGSESIYFTVPGKDGAKAVLQATFESDYEISDTEFRCLQAAAVLATSVLEFERMA